MKRLIKNSSNKTLVFLNCFFIFNSFKVLWWVQLSWLEHLVVAQEAVGSSPITHPKDLGVQRSPVNAPALGAGDREFKSLYPDTFTSDEEPLFNDGGSVIFRYTSYIHPFSNFIIYNHIRDTFFRDTLKFELNVIFNPSPKTKGGRVRMSETHTL